MRWITLLSVIGSVKNSFQMEPEELELLITFDSPNTIIIVTEEFPGLHLSALLRHFITWTNSEHLHRVLEAHTELGACNLILLSHQRIPHNMTVPQNVRVFTERTGKYKASRQLFLVQRESKPRERVVLLNGESLRLVRSWTKIEGIWHHNHHSSLNGTVIRLGYISAPPYFFLDENDQPNGFCYEIWQILSENLAFKMELVPSFDGNYGSLENGSWNGLMKLLIDALGEHRAQHGRYLGEVLKDKTILLTHRDVRMEKFMMSSILDRDVVLAWIGTVLVALLATLVMSVMEVRRTWTDDLLSTWSLICQQSICVQHSRPSRRILQLTVVGFGFLSFSVFSGGIVSVISVANEASDVLVTLQNVRELGFSLFVRGGTFMEAELKNAPEGSNRRQLWEKQVGKDPFYRPSDMDQLIENFFSTQRGALWIDGTSFAYWMKQQGPNFAHWGLLKPSVVDTRKQYSFITTSNSMLADEIYAKLLVLRESGLLEKLKDKWHLDSQYNGKPGLLVSSSFQGVSLNSVMAYFSIVIVGLFLCLAIGVLEHLVFSVP
ncbi:hypothetical protein TCAL_14483 [Tigriopus californicus]|uniref:Ionotropic glutamate receptor L-glutamate and glycine-binding domain-containing protein n=1 Tax=Tigriopus californicus TaxID=6832 RepID=A0A553PSR9_TIGCA|nr:hypothetical protein TCAL_14483 [Tigriopus californicus]